MPKAVPVAAVMSVAVLALASLSARTPRQIRFVFTSDVHYGITRPVFRNRADSRLLRLRDEWRLARHSTRFGLRRR